MNPEALLADYDLVLWLDDPEIGEFLNRIPLPEKKIVVLCRGKINIDGIAFRKLSEEKETALAELYGTYEFSDRFRRLSRSALYGGLWNYVETGLLTPEEAANALLNDHGNRTL